jgi:hypothetical protein
MKTESVVFPMRDNHTDKTKMSFFVFGKSKRKNIFHHIFKMHILSKIFETEEPESIDDFLIY